MDCTNLCKNLKLALTTHFKVNIRQVIYFSYSFLLVLSVLAFPSQSKPILLIWGFFLVLLVFYRLYYIEDPPEYLDLYPRYYLNSITIFMSITSNPRQPDIIPLSTYINTEENITCAICLDDVQTGSPVPDLPCNHVFHLNCSEKWFAIKASCPVCKQRLSNK